MASNESVKPATKRKTMWLTLGMILRGGCTIAAFSSNQNNLFRRSPLQALMGNARAEQLEEGNSAVSLARKKGPTSDAAFAFDDDLSNLWMQQPSPVTPKIGGLWLVLVVILGLSVNAGTTPDAIVENGVWDGCAKDAVSNVIDAAMPSTSADIVAVAIGEAIAGVVGAGCTLIVRTALMTTTTTANSNTGSIGRRQGRRTPFVNDAIADMDYFIASSATFPLLEAAGFSPGLASIISAVVASVPSTAAKLLPRQQEQRIKEETLLRQLLLEEQATAKTPLLEKMGIWKDPPRPEISTVNPRELTLVGDSWIDGVEIFSDVTRWLSYSVLQSDFGGSSGIMRMGDGTDVLDTFTNGAFLGFLAASSSQLYADALYGMFRCGPKSKQEEVITRRAADWVTIYAAKVYSAAVLFGVYECTQAPMTQWIQSILAGGLEGCLGSSDYNLCIQSYIDSNTPGPSFEAQLRAFVTNLVALGHHLQDVADDTTMEDFQVLFSGWSSAVFSYLWQFLHLSQT